MKSSRRLIGAISCGILISVLVGLCSPCFVSAESVEDLYGKARGEYQSLSQSPKKRWTREAWDRCIRHFEELIRLDAQRQFVDKSYFLIGKSYESLYRAYKEAGDFESAVQYYRKLVYEFTESNLADDAQYAMGELYMEKDASQAYPEFVKVGVLFPKGDMAPKAARRVAQLEKRLGWKPDERLKADQIEESVPTRASSSGPASAGLATPGARRSNPAEKPVSVRPKIAQVEGIEHWAAEDYSRVAVYVSGPVKFEQHTLPPDPASRRPARIYLDLKECVVAPEMKPKIPIMDGFLQGVRVGQFKAAQTRVVLDIQSIETFKVFSLPDPFRLVIDVRGKRDQTASSPSAKEGKGGGSEPRPKKAEVEKIPPPPSMPPQLSQGVKRIVLDPGHGGKDPGAVGPNGVCEKDVVLAVAKNLKNILESQLECEVFLTRTGDQFLSLEERTAIANMKKADLFVSIHVNAHKDSNVHGIETYYLNFANDEESARVAALENAMSAKKVSDLEAILHDLMFNTKIDESSRLAREVQGGMVRELIKGYEDVRDLGVKHAPFYVLLGAEMPCVLIETAFISNEREEQRLKEGSFQENLARGIANGVHAYVQHVKQMAQAE